MVRVVLSYIVPFLLPTALYVAWSWYRARYAAAHGGEAPKVERGPWPILIALGALLTLLTLAATALLQGSDAGSAYTPPHLENGRLIPGHMDAKPK
jgi:heme A synthase